MGNGEVRVRGAGGIWYVAPRLVIHYVVEHRYCPPQDFIEAVMSPSEIGKEEPIHLSEKDDIESLRDCDRRMREVRGPPVGEAEIDRIVRRGICETRPKQPWWRLW